ncbi:ATP-binding protein [Dankookia sp. GCM10030260]|uniref:ATP-binding protein n=1 Tax=Dankookia sp. GCM10030260 TaxID=3273390 RepID=UPI0036D37E0A
MDVPTKAPDGPAIPWKDLLPDGGATVAALLVTEEALADGSDALVICLAQQPPWSDLPVVVLTAGGRRRGPEGRWALFAGLGNVTLLDRPLHAETLRSAVRAALRARARQHETRRHLEALRLAAETLEARVEERTRALVTEVAERTAAQEQLRQAQKMEALGQLAGGVAHDFNNSSAAVLAGITLLEKRYSTTLAAAGPGALRLLAGLRDGAERGAAVSRRLLAFSRLERLNASVLGPAELLGGLRDMLANALGPGIRVGIEAPPGLPVLQADQRQLETVLINLAINARDAMSPDGGEVTFGAAPEIVAEAGERHVAGLLPGKYVRLWVTDTGAGMDTATLARATEPFFTTKPQDRGTGLGLSMAHGFAAQSGGALSLKSKPGRGTTVTLWLPQARREADMATAPVAGSMLRALVVDDVLLTRRYLCHCLHQSGWEATEANGAEALALLDLGEPFHLLLVRHSMASGVDAFTLARAARARRPGLLAVLVAGPKVPADFASLATSKGLHTLTEPVSPVKLEELLASLRPWHVAASRNEAAD